MAKTKPREITRQKQVRERQARKRAARRDRVKMARFDVDETRSWHLLRARPRWAAHLRRALEARGVPCFEATEHVKIERRGQVVEARIPILRRIVIAGFADTAERAAFEPHPLLDCILQRPDGCLMRIPPAQLQTFCDWVTGEIVPEAAAEEALFAIGARVRIAEGPFALFPGVVEAMRVEDGAEVYTVAVSIFGRATPVEIDEYGLEPA